jgi:NADH:ubiquinone oxidoreductase subunit 2 (subunit N)
MLSHLFLNLLPWVVVAAFSILLTAESLWRAMGSTEQSNGLTHVVTKVSLILILVIAALVSLNTSLPNLTVLRKFQLLLAMCLLVVVLAHALSQPNSSKSSQLDTALLMLFSALTALFLILSSNLITLFLALELVNMLILYSFLATSHRSIESSHASGAAVVSACVYQFILNFFSSIVMFVGISGYVSVTGGADISAARIFLDDQSVSGYASMLLLAFLLKFGTGP